MEKEGDAHAEDQLRLFWKRWRVCRPNHQVFEGKDDDSLGRTLPVLLHGDEGRGHKRQGLMCICVASALGKGVETRSKKDLVERNDSQRMNYVGTTLCTRFLLSVLPKAACENKPSIFQGLVALLVDDLVKLANEGLTSPITGKKHYVAFLHVKGDWPFLAKIGNLNRSFANAPKRATARKPCTGVCHYCLAGRPDIPFEDLSERAEWQYTIGVEDPWAWKPPVFRLHHDNTFSASFLAADPFHTFHLGEGRHLVANCIKLILPEARGTNVDSKLESLFEDYKMFCKKQRLQCYAVRFNASLFNIGGNEFPKGSWTKGNFTTSLVKWLACYLNQRRNSYPAGSAWQLAVSRC